MERLLNTNIKDQQKSKILFEMTELALTESASLISSLGHAVVKFTVDSIDIHHKNGLDDVINPGEPDMLAVCHHVDGANSSNIVFLQEELSGLVFTKQILNDGDHLKELSEMEEEAFTEIGNIIINNILSHYVQVLNKSISTMIPTLNRGHYVQLFDELTGGSDEKEIYTVKFSIDITSHQFSAYILWVDHLCQLSTAYSADSQIFNLKG